MTLPVADPWYRCESLDARTWRLTEPHVHPIFAANIFLVLGRDADLVVDSGMGVAPLRPEIEALRPEPANPLILFSTHTHVDHIGAAHEFETRLIHPLEAEELANPAPYPLETAGLSDAFRTLFLDAGYPPLWPLLINALPQEGFDPGTYKLKGAPATKMVEDGDIVDLGDWSAEVLHLPGHSPGQVGLWHAPSGTLFGADAIYDGPLLLDETDTARADYCATLAGIRALPLQTVLGGHEAPMGPERCRAICDHYLGLWA